MHRMASVLAIVVAMPLAAVAQQSPAQPYAGLDSRTVKGLSAEQIADLKAGRGMGLALPAELNGYPGPTHVLELAGPLGLTPDQRARTEALIGAMKAEAIPLGERVLAGEAALDLLFAEKRVTVDSLDSASAQIGVAQAALRAAHLRYHLDMLVWCSRPNRSHATPRCAATAAAPIATDTASKGIRQLKVEWTNQS